MPFVTTFKTVTTQTITTTIHWVNIPTIPASGSTDDPPPTQYNCTQTESTPTVQQFQEEEEASNDDEEITSPHNDPPMPNPTMNLGTDNNIGGGGGGPVYGDINTGNTTTNVVSLPYSEDNEGKIVTMKSNDCIRVAGKNKYICKFCGKSFTRKYTNLTTHVLNKHRVVISNTGT